MEPSQWIGFGALALTIATNLILLGRWGGRQERRVEETEGEHVGRSLRRSGDHDMLDVNERVDELQRRFNVFEEDWRRNRETWHQRFSDLDTARSKMLAEGEHLYVRRDEFDGTWKAIGDLRSRVNSLQRWRDHHDTEDA